MNFREACRSIASFYLDILQGPTEIVAWNGPGKTELVLVIDQHGMFSTDAPEAFNLYRLEKLSNFEKAENINLTVDIGATLPCWGPRYGRLKGCIDEIKRDPSAANKYGIYNPAAPNGVSPPGPVVSQ
ncbi:MAG TPA: hypothetical protein PKW15_05490 [Alphaproteobacteria bacterium]|nr:hypothetical protein [Alphaproteobacteria bacterium]